MTENELRTLYVDTARSYYGAEKGSDQHKEILAIYNGYEPLARGYRMTGNDPWCAAFVSAMAIRCGLTDIIPTECSCSRMIQLHKALGTWVEADGYTPKPGDLILYDWDDDGSGDCTGDPEHIGIVDRVKDDVIRVIEGNMGGRVWSRDVAVNGKYVRGYCCPDFAGKEETDMSKFKDVKDGTYYADSVDRAAELGLMIGLSETEFGVGQAVTREQLATVAVRIYDLLSGK